MPNEFKIQYYFIYNTTAFDPLKSKTTNQKQSCYNISTLGTSEIKP